MESRLLIYAPTGQDGPLVARVLASVVHCVVCANSTELQQQLAHGAAVVLTVEEALPLGAFSVLEDYVGRQPAWSDLPLLLLTRRGTDSATVRHAVAQLGNVTLLERPVRTLTLITSIKSLLRARSRQFELREADRRKDEFLASLGHELRNPLAPIKTSAALLAHLYPDAAPVRRIEQVIERQVGHLTRLVDDLLDVARITGGKIALQRADVWLSALLQHVHELCAPAAALKDLQLDLVAPPPDLLLHADAARVVQILSNIVSNAVKFTPAGGRIRLGAVRAADAGDTLEVTISDNGIGLEAEAIGRIFAMFEQSKTVQGQMSSGLGIGLSLARQFAEMHDGSVSASSAGPGLGSTFVVRLPVLLDDAAPAAAPVAGAAAPVGATPRQRRVLVVDDNRDAADSLATLFDMAGFSVTVVYDGASAVQAAAALPELLVMDLGMPGMDGYAAARLIRQLPGADAVLMLALTGWGQGDARRRTADAGFDHHLIKPVDFNDILRLANAA